jgi:hypothetical protein
MVGRPCVKAVLKAVELVSDQLAKPGQDCVGLGSCRYRFESSTSEPFADDRWRGAFRIGQQKTGGQMARRILFSASRYSLQQKLLIHHSSQIR